MFPALKESEDERITEIKTFIAQCNGFNRTNREKVFEMLDALKDRYTWKPSDEQIKALERAMRYCPETETLKDAIYILEQLKKLREE
jgi:hypothetical protein